MKNFNEMIKPSLVLVIICLVVTASLAVTYGVTKPVIDEINLQKANESRNEVLPEGEGAFTQIEKDLSENVLEAYQAQNGSGMVFTCQDKGFGGSLTVMVGINMEGEIQGVKVTKHGETPGLGTKAMTPDYLSQYNGQIAVTMTDEPGETAIDAVTGATLTSSAVYRAVETALAQFEMLGGAK